MNFFKMTLGLLLLLPTPQAYARSGGGILLPIGAQRANLKDLDESLSNNGWGHVGNSRSNESEIQTVGGRLFFYNSGLLTSIEGISLLPRSQKERSGMRSSLSGTYGLFCFGPAYSSDNGFIFSPGLGVGLGRLDLRFEREKNLGEVTPSDSATYDDGTAQPAPNSSNMTSQFAVGSAHVDVIFGRDSGGFVFGFRGGYLHTSDNAPWKTSRGSGINELPDPTIRGPYGQFVIGVGNF